MKIEKNVPLPECFKLILEKMEVEDSLLIPEKHPHKKVAKLRVTAWLLLKETGKKFITRTVEEGTRTWRVK